jgi:hypothetical protein
MPPKKPEKTPEEKAVESGPKIDASNVNNREVHNANQLKLSDIQPVSIATFSGQDGIRIYPNPTSGRISVLSAANQTISVYNVLGEKVLSRNVKHQVEIIDLSSLDNGTYIIRIEGNNTIVTRKIVLNKFH